MTDNKVPISMWKLKYKRESSTGRAIEMCKYITILILFKYYDSVKNIAEMCGHRRLIGKLWSVVPDNCLSSEVFPPQYQSVELRNFDMNKPGNCLIYLTIHINFIELGTMTFSYLHIGCYPTNDCNKFFGDTARRARASRLDDDFRSVFKFVQFITIGAQPDVGDFCVILKT